MEESLDWNVCPRCGEQVSKDGIPVVEEDDNGEFEVVVHWGCVGVNDQRQMLYDWFAEGVHDPSTAIVTDNDLWNSLWPDEREIVLAMLNSDHREVRDRMFEGVATEAMREKRRADEAELRAKALRVLGLGGPM